MPSGCKKVRRQRIDSSVAVVFREREARAVDEAYYRSVYALAVCVLLIMGPWSSDLPPYKP